MYLNHINQTSMTLDNLLIWTLEILIICTTRLINQSLSLLTYGKSRSNQIMTSCFVFEEKFSRALFGYTRMYRAINNYLDKGRLWLWQCQIFRIFADAANKRQTTVTMNQILIQKWFLLQNIKDSLLNRIDVFNNGKLTFSAVACLVEFQ
jgi:hypothetical protein